MSSNDSYATAAFANNGDASNFLKCTGFGFSIPSGSTIVGIEVDWEDSNTSGGTVQDNAARLVKGGTIGSTDRSSGTAWPNGDTLIVHGGVTDLWGDTWTAADINSSNFGAALSAFQNSGGYRTGQVDSVSVHSVGSRVHVDGRCRAVGHHVTLSKLARVTHRFDTLVEPQAYGYIHFERRL